VDALFSGQAGLMALLEGAEARVLRADDFDFEIRIGREASDISFKDATTSSSSRREGRRSPH